VNVCSSCGYKNNQAGDHSCNLCGKRLGAVLPKSGLSSRREAPRTGPQKRYTQRLDTAASRPAGRRKPEDEPETASHGLKRLEEAQERVTRKLERLSDIQSQTAPILRLQIQAERDDKALVDEITSAEAELAEKTKELEDADSTVRQQRKKIAALRFELRRVAEERIRGLEEKQTLNDELNDLRRIAGELDGAPSDAKRMGAEVEGLQTVCLRLSERITMLTIKLEDRESWLHWLVREVDPDVEEEKQRVLESIATALDQVEDPAEFLHWLSAKTTERAES
jgi:chromosome segregation ATPase